MWIFHVTVLPTPLSQHLCIFSFIGAAVWELDHLKQNCSWFGPRYKKSSWHGAGANAGKKGYFLEVKVWAECDSGEDKGISQTAMLVCLSLQWRMLMATYKQIHPLCSPWFTRMQADTQIQNLMAAAVCEFIFVSVMNATFLPGFHGEGCKRALNRKQGTSEISQATRASWIIQSKLTTCCHVAISIESCLTCKASLECFYVELCWCIFTCWTRGLGFFRCSEFWSLDGVTNWFKVQAKEGQYTKGCRSSLVMQDVKKKLVNCSSK